KALNVPVGLIHTSWGGTAAEAWTSPEALKANPDLKYMQERFAKAMEGFTPEIEKKNKELQEQHADAVKQAKAAGLTPPPAPKLVPNPAASPNPTTLYNGMIAPLIPFAIKGAIWYQGESNAGRAYEYRTLFPAMIEDWRKSWGQGDFPFLFVQL